ncbi:MAG: hypothetical protein JO022_15350 [Acidobacteriaceae bacterium]|nr:hypothetical protein [Acidobacteriaceae bacterium]
MRYVCVLLISLSGLLLSGQSVGPNPPSELQVLQSREIQLAKQEIERVTDLVNAGALPRIRLEEAEQKLADAQDEVILSRTLYGEMPVKNLTEEMADEMVAAAQRRVERQTKKIEETQKLITQGVLPQVAINPLQDELQMRTMNLNLAHSRAKLMGELIALNRYELSMKALQAATHVEPYTDYTMHSMVHYSGNGMLLGTNDLHQLETSFAKRFEHPLPISADGQTATHNVLGFDHRGRVDVAVNPTDPEGMWLRHYLEAKGVPYYAFMRAIPGKATGAHIHIGPGSMKLHNAD